MLGGGIKTSVKIQHGVVIKSESVWNPMRYYRPCVLQNTFNWRKSYVWNHQMHIHFLINLKTNRHVRNGRRGFQYIPKDENSRNGRVSKFNRSHGDSVLSYNIFQRFFGYDLTVNAFSLGLENFTHNENNETTSITAPMYYSDASICTFLCSFSLSLSLILSHADF